MPDEIFTNIKQVDKNAWDTEKLVGTETEEEVAELDVRSSGDSTKKKRLDPVNSTSSQRAMVEQMIQRLQVRTTKARRWVIVSKRGQTLGRIENAMSNLPIEVGDQTIKR